MNWIRFNGFYLSPACRTPRAARKP